MTQGLNAFLPMLAGIDQSPLMHDHGLLWRTLERLLNANAPRAGCALPGGIGRVIGQIADEHRLAENFTPNYANTGNAAITLGVHKPQPDLVIVAHMDRPSFRVRNAGTGEIYPVCALRLPDSGYTCAAKAVRYDAAARALVVASHGTFHGHGSKLRYETTEPLRSTDTILMDAVPTLHDGIITGTGLDNCLGVISALGAAAAFHEYEQVLNNAQKRVLIAFTDEEEGIPEVFFGHGAARLGRVVLPDVGAIICDGQNVGDGMIPQVGRGATHGIISAWGRGSLVAPNYVALAETMMTYLPHGTVQLNDGYLSRSDDMGMSRWTRVLGMIGAPVRDPHTAHESAALSDVAATMYWLTAYAAACLGLSSGLNGMFAL